MTELPGLLPELPVCPRAMDALSDVLRTMRLRGGVFLHAEFSEPWCISVRVLPESCAPFLRDPSEVIPYHYVLEGTLRVRMRAQPVMELAPGEAILFPRNDEHVLGGDLRLAPVPSEQVVQRPGHGELLAIQHGGGGARTRIVCGFLGGSGLADNPVVSALPASVRFDTRGGEAAAWVKSSFNLAAEEVARGRIGSETILERLSELLFVQAVRQYVAALPKGQRGWLAGLEDPYVSRALALLHAHLAHPWTLDELGRRVGLSRSALGSRFSHCLGTSPMSYLARWRVQVAARELCEGHATIARIAERVGYESEAAFSRAFKRFHGKPPAAFRRRAGAG